MTAILMILFAVMFAFMLLYQNAVLIYAATYSAQQGAEFWSNSGRNIDTGAGYTEDNLYFRIQELNSNDSLVASKKQKIETAARDKLARGILSPKKTTINVTFENNLLQRTITVDISQQIPFPFMGIAKYFGNHNEGLVLRAKAKSTVSEPAEYIRNIDLAMEYVQRFTEVISIKKLMSIK